MNQVAFRNCHDQLREAKIFIYMKKSFKMITFSFLCKSVHFLKLTTFIHHQMLSIIHGIALNCSYSVPVVCLVHFYFNLICNTSFQSVFFVLLTPGHRKQLFITSRKEIIRLTDPMSKCICLLCYQTLVKLFWFAGLCLICYFENILAFIHSICWQC